MMSNDLPGDTLFTPRPRRASLVDEVVSKLRALIETNGLTPGQRLPSETELTSQMAVSRTVLREAVRELGTVGLIQVRHGHGMFVGDSNAMAEGVALVRRSLALVPRDLTQFVELRTALECHAARRAAELAMPEHDARLEDYCHQMDIKDLPYEKSIQLDFSFHRALFEISGNPLMLGVLNMLQELIVEGMLQTTPIPRDRQVSQNLHYAIVEAVRQRDPAAAEAAMREHMSVTEKRLSQSARRVKAAP